MTFKEFCEANEIAVLECAHSGIEETRVEPYALTSRMYQYLLVLKRGLGALFRTKWATGEGNVERWARETNAKLPRSIFPGGERIERASQLPGRWNTIAGRDFLDGIAPQYRPEVADVLQCLASDAQGIQNARDFEDWAEDLGYDTDSRKAEVVYRECCDLTLSLQRWLGLEKYVQLLECTEDDL